MDKTKKSPLPEQPKPKTETKEIQTTEREPQFIRGTIDPPEKK